MDVVARLLAFWRTWHDAWANLAGCDDPGWGTVPQSLCLDCDRELMRLLSPMHPQTYRDLCCPTHRELAA